MRCNLVTVENQVMRDFTAGHISTDEALLATRDRPRAIGRRSHLQFVPGVSYRNLMIYRGSESSSRRFPANDTRTTPPHDLTDKSVLDDYPRGPGSSLLSQLMWDSVGLFAEGIPWNLRRRGEQKLSATNVWLWGQGQAAPPLRLAFTKVYGNRAAATITAVDLLRGLAAADGLAADRSARRDRLH